MNLLFFALILSPFYSPTHCEHHFQWISHANNTLPRQDTMFAIGSYNDSIYLLGGFLQRRQQTTYDIKTNSFVFYRSGFIPLGNKVFGEAQFWTQIGSKLYILNDGETVQINNLETVINKLSVYNMETNSYISSFDRIPVAMSDGMGRACITSGLNSIFINGGITKSETLRRETYVLNIATDRWGLASSMLTARRSHSCIIHPENNILYSIGGSTNNNALIASIEKISIDNYQENAWIYLNKSLSKPVKGLRSFIIGKHIVIIGGIDGKIMTEIIHFIDITTDILYVSNITLAFPIAYSGVCAVNNILYSFGGGFGSDKWQSFNTIAMDDIIDTIAPTTSTTKNAELDIDTNTTTTTIIKEEEEDNVLTAGNKVGIGFAVALLICLILVVIFFCIRDKTTKKRKFSNDFDVKSHHSSDHDDDDMEDNNMNGNMNVNGKFEKNDHEEKVDSALMTHDW